jgi:hypothetical protein
MEYPERAKEIDERARRVRSELAYTPSVHEPQRW